MVVLPQESLLIMQEDEPSRHPLRRRRCLTRTEQFHLAWMILAWACTMSCQTLVVGTSAVIVLSVGGTPEESPFALGVFFGGMSLVSVTLTPWLFERWGRKIGFWVGIGLGWVGSGVGLWGCFWSSPWLVILANLPMGMGIGIGMYLRFAVVEVVPPSHAATATTLVLSGGCLAALAGPETARWTRGKFGNDDDEHLTYLGVFLVTSLFLLLEALFISQVTFPADILPAPTAVAAASSSTTTTTTTSVVGLETTKKNPAGGGGERRDQEEDGQGVDNKEEEEEVVEMMLQPEAVHEDAQRRTTETLSLFLSRQFWIPMLIAALSWAIMAMPMSLTVVAMQQMDFTSTQALRTIEVHFLGMFGPGFVSGVFIRRVGFRTSTLVTVVFFALGVGLFNLTLSTEKDDGRWAHGTAPWMGGLVFLGIGWNIGFSAATIQLSQLYDDNDDNHPAADGRRRYPKSIVQAANDGWMFLLSGIGIFCSGYIYEGGGSYLDGWKTLNAVALGLCGGIVLILVVDLLLGRILGGTRISSNPSSRGSPPPPGTTD